MAPRLIRCNKVNLAVEDWFLWYDELQKSWLTGELVDGNTVQLSDGAILDLDWVPDIVHRIVK